MKERERKTRDIARAAVCCVTALALVGAFGLAGCSSADDAADDETATTEESTDLTAFTLGYLNSTSHVLAFVAAEEGFFEDEGLDVTLTQFDSGTELVSSLEADKLDAAFIGSVPAIANQSSGSDVTIFGGAMTNGHGYVIDSQYTEGLDEWDVTILKGKTVAVPRTTTQELELLQILTEYGLTYAEDDSADVKLVYFDSQSDAYAALTNDEIDAASCYSPYTSLAVEAGYSIVYQCSDEEIFENQPCCRQVAETEDLENDPELYEAFERALIRAYDFYKNNADETVADVKVYVDIDDELIDYELYAGYADSNPDPDKQATTALKDDVVAIGYAEDYDIDALYNTSIYEAALASLLEEDPDNESYVALQEHFEQYE